MPGSGTTAPALRITTSPPPAVSDAMGGDRPRLCDMWFRRVVDVAFVIAVVLGAIVLVIAIVAGT